MTIARIASVIISSISVKPCFVFGMVRFLCTYDVPPSWWHVLVSAVLYVGEGGFVDQQCCQSKNKRLKM